MGKNGLRSGSGKEMFAQTLTFNKNLLCFKYIFLQKQKHFSI
jgi:hypothetical protein